MSDLLYSDTEEALRDSVRRLFADRCPAESVMRAYGPAPHDFSDVWHALAADLGMAGLLVPEQLGGAGAGAREAAVVMEEIGRAVAPVPFLSSAVLATVALLEAGELDRLSITLCPELVGAGARLFGDGPAGSSWSLTEVTPTGSGALCLRYDLIRPAATNDRLCAAYFLALIFRHDPRLHIERIS